MTNLLRPETREFGRKESSADLTPSMNKNAL